MRGEGVAQHMRAHPFRRDTRSSSQFLHHLVKPDAAQMTFAGGEKPRRFRCHMDRPLGNGSPRPIRYRRQSLLAALSSQDQERPVSCNGLAGQRNKLTGAEARSIKRSEEHTSELQSLMRTSYAVFCLKKKK